MLTPSPFSNNLYDFQNYQIVRAFDEACQLRISMFGYFFYQQKQVKILLGRTKS